MKKLFSKKNFKKLKKPNFKFRWTTKASVITVVSLCVVLLGVTGWLWWTQIFTNPDRILDDAIAKSMQTNSVTRKVVQGEAKDGVTQTALLSFYPPEVSAQTLTALSQRGQNRKVTTVTTETVGTTKTDFVRYVGLEGGEGLPGAENFDRIKGQWAKKEQSGQTGEKVTFLNEALFGVVPFGNLKPADRKQLLDFINQKNLYKVNSKPERMVEDYRYVYIYNISVKPTDLVELIGKYMRLTNTGDPSTLNSLEYEGAPPISVQITVDIASRNIVKINYGSTERSETYSGYNLYKPATKPEGTITLDELQKRLDGEGA